MDKIYSKYDQQQTFQEVQFFIQKNRHFSATFMKKNNSPKMYAHSNLYQNLFYFFAAARL